MLVKDTQPQLLDDMPTVFALAPIAGEQRTVSETLARGHGRLERWSCTYSHLCRSNCTRGWQFI